MNKKIKISLTLFSMSSLLIPTVTLSSCSPSETYDKLYIQDIEMFSCYDPTPNDSSTEVISSVFVPENYNASNEFDCNIYNLTPKNSEGKPDLDNFCKFDESPDGNGISLFQEINDVTGDQIDAGGKKSVYAAQMFDPYSIIGDPYKTIAFVFKIQKPEEWQNEDGTYAEVPFDTSGENNQDAVIIRATLSATYSSNDRILPEEGTKNLELIQYAGVDQKIATSAIVDGSTFSQGHDDYDNFFYFTLFGKVSDLFGKHLTPNDFDILHSQDWTSSITLMESRDSFFSYFDEEVNSEIIYQLSIENSLSLREPIKANQKSLKEL